jgi:hypothetical protein
VKKFPNRSAAIGCGFSDDNFAALLLRPRDTTQQLSPDPFSLFPGLVRISKGRPHLVSSVSHKSFTRRILSRRDPTEETLQPSFNSITMSKQSFKTEHPLGKSLEEVIESKGSKRRPCEGEALMDDGGGRRIHVCRDGRVRCGTRDSIITEDAANDPSFRESRTMRIP